MLFDLQGRRKTAVKVVYMGLALLIGGGLVLFGIGSGGINGGLADAILGSSGNSNFKKQVERREATVRLHPKDPEAYAELIRARFGYVGSDNKFFNTRSQSFTPAGKRILKQLTIDWKKYQTLVKKPNPVIASYVVQGYVGLENPKGAERTQQLIAEARPDASNYLLLFQYALSAGDPHISDLAAKKAVALAPHSEQADVKKAIKDLKTRRARLIQKQIAQQLAQQNAQLKQKVQKQGAGGANGAAPQAGGPQVGPVGNGGAQK